jgi:hypothetical protein
VIEIGGEAFSNCNNLQAIYSTIENPGNVSYGDYIFIMFEEEKNCKLFVPKGTVEAYQSTEPWSAFTDIIEYNGDIGEQTHVKGDVDGDGVVTAGDITVIYNILLGNKKDETHNQ